MAIRTIEYSVSADGISPAVRQSGGIQGEHKATQLLFRLDSALVAKIREEAAGEEVYYRFDGTTGSGNPESSEPELLDGTELYYPLENWLTAEGGNIEVKLAITLMKTNGAGELETKTELYTFSALLHLKNNNTGGKNQESLSTLAVSAKKSAARAEEAAEKAAEAQGKTELVKAALESGTIWIFDGGDAEGDVDLDGDGEIDFNIGDIKFVIDNEMSGSSENAVKNKVIKAYVDNAISELTEDFNSSFINKEEKETLEENINSNTEAISNFEERDKDYIVSKGEIGIWNYRKWESGLAECWCSVEANAEFHDDWGGLTYGTGLIALPENLFKEKPESIIIQPISRSGLYACSVNSIDKDKVGFYTVELAGQIEEDFTIDYSITAKGKWEVQSNE